MGEGLRTPLSQVRGLGSAKGGTSQFIAQRISAIALLFLAPWFAIGVPLAAREGFDGARDFFSHPINAVAAALLVIAACTHMQIGMNEIIEDYLRKPVAKTASLLANTLVAFAFAVAGLFAILKISLGV